MIHTREQVLKPLLKLVAVITVLSGLGQAILPELVLGLVGADITPASSHFFGIVGMFMVLFGGLLLHALIATRPQPIAVLWCGLQKVGATGAVALGVLTGVFRWPALGVAAFDLVSAALICAYWMRIRKLA